MRLGVDFDNTIACYDRLFAELAAAAGHVAAGGKRAVRDAVRAGPAGDLGWQRLQATAYGSEMHRARPFAGVRETLAALRRAGIDVAIVSHKTERAAAAPDGPDLRRAALDWLAAQGFFEAPVGLRPERVHFLPTRQAKLQAIAAAGCTHFVDDLVELFLEPGFPAGVGRLLFDPAGEAPGGPWRRFASWSEIGGYLAGARAA